MTKKEVSKMDLEFVKEYEELRLKQKLLIENLKRKAKTQESELFMEVNSKLNFLVKIFKDSIKEDEEAQAEKTSFEENMTKKIDELMEKIESVSSSLTQKIDALEKKLANAGPLSSSSADDGLPSKNESTSTEDKKEGDSLPPPDFKSEIKDGEEADAKNEGPAKKEKKKWF